MKNFSLIIKQCYLIVWSAEKIQKVKFQKLQQQKKENQSFHKNVHCVAVKYQDLSEKQAASGL